MTTVEEQVADVRTGLPQAGTWVLDPAHSSIEFVARHMMVTKVRGHFGDFQGAIHIGENVTDSWAEATMKSSSFTTREAKRDEHLSSADFLETEAFPELTFRSTSLRHIKGNRYEADGELTIKGITKPVVLDVEYHGLNTNPWGAEVAFFSASTEINREDFGMTWNAALESGGVLVSKKVQIEIEAQASLQR